ncbi:MAG: hypothetical protein V1773_11515 [bacterium]
MLKKYAFTLFFVFISITLLAQVTPQTVKYRNDAKGDYNFRKKGVMDGNQVRTLFYNNGEVGQWPLQPSGEWPKGTGQSYLDGVCALVTIEMTAPGNNQVVHPLQTSYREWMDKDPNTGKIWGFEPVPGYVNASSEKPSINTDPKTWPSFWPKVLPLIDETWDGYWYGYFGRGVQNSDFETFFVMDDSQDGEYTRLPFSYFPIDSDHDRGGLGLRVEVRGFQWSHVLAEDIIFWHYDIINISDFSYPTTYFGFYTDCGVGGKDDSEDDCASFDKTLDLAYAYDNDGLGAPIRWKTGFYGYAYLESPGNSSNGIDDDSDGLVDEKRDDGIDNDNDWTGYIDLNGNGKWDAENNEPLNDDVGQDGVGPWDVQYNGPDYGEGDGTHTPGEPNFDATDKDESDQIGLTAVSLYRLGQGGTGGGWPKDDESMWLKMSAQTFDTTIQRTNISMVFASGPFPLNSNLRERFSMALVFGSNLEDLIFNKETVQQIYNANYNFSKPPIKPILTAVAGDGKVFLYWDSKSEESRDAFLGFENNDPTLGYKKDFEGYMILRSQEAEFNDLKIITDSKGEPKYYKPLAQFDKIDGIKGPDPVGINGAHFWRGDDSGLQHTYIDADVTNGQRYYYALVAYDQGDPNFGTKGLQPTETTKIISEDYAGNLSFVDINCAVVTPNAAAAGLVPPQIKGDLANVSEGIGTGKIKVDVINPSEINSNVSYKIKFNSTGTFPTYKTVDYSILRSINGGTDTTLISNIDTTNFGLNKYSPPFDGLTVSVSNDTSVAVIDTATGWLKGTSNLFMFVRPDRSSPAKNIAWPADYVLEFLPSASVITPLTKIPVNFIVKNLTENDTVDAEILDNNKNKIFDLGDNIVIIEYIGTNYKLTWNISYIAPLGGATPVEPVAGDLFRITTTKPFLAGDYFSFTTVAATNNKDLANTELEKIKVVPNPYISTAKWERRTLYQSGRGERRIDFIHLPNFCTIRIYTMAGALVKTITKDSGPYDGSLSWNLVTEDGMDCAYGVYIYHVDAPGIGEYIGKFSIIK